MYAKKSFLLILASTFLINFNIICMEQTILENKEDSLSQDETISAQTFYKGKCTIDGQNHTLTLESTITIAPDSTLWLKDVTIKNANKIKLASKTSKILFSGYVILEITDFEFDFGSFSISKNSQLRLSSVEKSHKSKFLYKTDQKSFLDSGASLELDNVMFIYCPETSADDLISLISLDSCILLIDSKIFLGKSLHLTTGCLYLKGDSLLDGEQGVTLNLVNEKDNTNKACLYTESNETKEVPNIKIIG